MRSDSVYDLPQDLPVPADDGACAHLPGMALPNVALPATTGDLVDVARTAGSKRTVFFFYPRSGRPDEEPPAGWDQIPGARGCTPQSCAYRDHFSDFASLGVQVYGVSAQDTAYQQEFAARTELPYPLLSDAAFRLTSALRLPTFEADGMRLIKRLTLITSHGKIGRVMYPVFPPDRNAEEVLAYLRSTKG